MYGNYKKKSYKGRGKKKKYHTKSEKASYWAGVQAGKRMARGNSRRRF